MNIANDKIPEMSSMHKFMMANNILEDKKFHRRVHTA